MTRSSTIACVAVAIFAATARAFCRGVGVGVMLVCVGYAASLWVVR